MTLEEYKAKKNKNSTMTLEEYKAKKYNIPQTVVPAKAPQPVSTTSESSKGFKSLPLEDVKKMGKEERAIHNRDLLNHLIDKSAAKSSSQNTNSTSSTPKVSTLSKANANLSKTSNFIMGKMDAEKEEEKNIAKQQVETNKSENIQNNGSTKGINLHGGGAGRTFENDSLVKFGNTEVPKSKYFIDNATLTTPEIMYNNMSLPQKAEVKAKKIGNTGLNLVGNAVGSVLKGYESLVDFGAGTLGRGLERITRDYTPEIQHQTGQPIRISDNVEQMVSGKPTELSEKIRKETEEFIKPNYGGEVIEKINNKTTGGLYGKYNPKVLGIPAENIAGEMARMYSLAPLGGVIGMGISAGGNNMEEALNDGEKLENAYKYGAVTGTIEGLTEKMFDTFNLIGGGRLDKYLPKSAIGKFITGSVGEGLEEVASEAAEPFAKMVTYEGDVENPFSSGESTKKYFENIGQAGWQGFVMGMFMQGAHDVSDAEIRAEYKKEIGEAIDKLNNLTNQQKAELKKEMGNIADNSEIQLSTVQKYLAENSNYSQYIPQNYNSSADITFQNANKPKSLEELVPTGKANVQNDTQNVQNNQVDKTNQAENKTAVKDNMEQNKQNLIKDVENNKYLNEQEKKSFIDTINEIEYTEDVEKDVRRTMNVFEEERGLKNITNNFNETRPIYNKYTKDNLDYDKQYIDLAKDSVKANNSGKRTKEQWLQVAKNLGNQIYEMSDAEVEKQAFKSWIDNRPNNANVLNRQGKKYVKFTMDDWVNQVYDTVRAARNNAQQGVENKALQTTAETVQNTAENKTTAQRDTVYSMAKETNKKQVPGIKQKQLDIIKSTNPMTDDYHTGIRNVEDIKSFNETLNDEESFTYGDFTREDALKAIEKGEVTVYSSKPMANGGFVSTSYNMAKDYAGSGKVYSETVPLEDVAWINGDEGQLARVENNQQKEYNINKVLQKKIRSAEINQLAHAINTDTPNLRNGINCKEYGNYFYIFTKNGFDDYIVDGKISIIGNEDLISLLRGEIYADESETTDRRSKTIDKIFQRAKNGRNYNNYSNVTDTRGRTSTQNVELYRRQLSDTNKSGYSETSNANKSKLANNTQNSNKSSFILPDIDYTQNKNLTSAILDQYSTFHSANGVDSKRFSDFFNKHKSDFDDYQNPYVMNLERKGALSRDIYNINDNLVKLTTIKEGDKLFIEELYVEKQRQGAGSKVVKILQEYAKKAGLEIETSHELNTAKGFWDKTLNREDSNDAGNKPAFSMPENTTDNKGRELSKQQQEYFKDSKVRDENGNLMTVYHMTGDNFTKIDFKKNAQGLFWFTTSKDALLNGEVSANGTRNKTNANIMEMYANIKKPANYEEYDKYTIQQLKDKGFDGALFDEGDGTIVGFAFDNSNQFKNIDNTKPTTDEDIRKFKSSENGKPYMDLNEHVSTDNNSQVKRVGLSQIEKAINDIVTTKVGKFRQKAYGIYKNNAEIIRLKEKNDIPVALHELTHHLDKKYGLSDLGKFDDELSSIAVAKEDASMATKIAEGVAEFGRYYMTDKEYAKSIAPKYYEAFEKALASEPEMKNNVEKLQNMVSDYLNQSPLNRMASHIDFGDEEASLWQKSKSKLAEFKKTFRKNFVDELDPMKKIVEDITKGEKLDVENNPTEMMRLLNGVTGKVRVALEYGIVDNKGNKIGKSLKEIVKPVSNNMEEFIAYASALRAKDLQNNNIESGFNQKDVDEIINLYKDNETFNKATKELYEFQNQVLEKTLVDSGIITKEALEAYNKKNPHYVPFYRVMDENFKQSKDSLSKKPKKIKGSTRDIINPIESIIKNTYSYTLIAEKNKIYRTLFDMAKKYDGTGKWFDKVPTDMVGETVSAKDVKDILEKLNLDREDIDYNEVFTTIFKPSYNQKGNIITVMEKGKPVHYEINDKELYDILAPAYSNKKEGLLNQFLYKGASALRVGATHSLEFVFRNPIRDTFTAGAFSENGFVPLVDTIRGIFEVVGKSDLYYKWLESGGSGSTYTNAQRTTLKNTLKDILPETTRKNNSTMEKTLDILLNTTKHPLKTYLDVVGNISNMMEEGTRLGEFRKAYKKTNDLKKSALDSRDITVDFSRGGVEGKEWNRKVAFLNANIQGLDKTVRSFKERPFATSMKVLAMLTIPSILLRLLQDPDDMDKIAQWEKDTYWVFYVNGVPIKIPKPQGPIQMFATLPERVVDFIRAKDPHAFDGLIERTISSSSPIDGFSSILPTAWQPLIETIFNYSIFRQQPIVKQSLQNRSPKYQYDENTSTVAKMVGGATNTSPKKIDNLISGYFGNLGKDVVNLAGVPIDMVNLLATGGKKENKKEYKDLNSTLRKTPLVKGFVANDTYSRALDNFYDEKAKVSTAYTDAKFVYGDKPSAEQSKELEKLKELNSKYNKAYNEIKKLNEQVDNIKQSDYSNIQKKNMIATVQKEIDKKAKELEEELEEQKKSIKRLK